MPDRHAVIWSRGTQGSHKMGDLVLTDQECRFSYTAEFLAMDDANGLALLANPELFGTNPVIYRSSARMPFHPRLMALTPGEAPGNIQRRIYNDILAKRKMPPMPGLDTEWELLLLAGHGGIGHIDVFRDDRAAEQWYGRDVHRDSLIGQRSSVWRFIREDIEQTAPETDTASIARLLGPTPSVGGMIPKLLVAIPDRPDWSGRFAPPGTHEHKGERFTDVVLKIEPAIYSGVLALEALCYDVHRELGFDIPRIWRNELDGMPLLAVERFDRDSDAVPVPMESFLSVLASGSREVMGSTDIDMAGVAAMLTKLATVVNLDPRRAQEQVFQRFCAALLTGNGDMHLENLAFLGGPRQVRIAPVYDPAPMRAWPRHNLRSAIPIDFDAAKSVGENLLELGITFGQRRTEVLELFARFLEVTQHYPERVMALDEVPLERRQQLVDIVRKERAVLATVLG